MTVAACTGDTDTTHTATTGTTPAATGGVTGHDEKARAGAVLRQQQQALRQGRGTEFVSTWAPLRGARRQARDIARNLHALRASVSSLHAVPVPAGDAAVLPASVAGRPTWKAGVDVTWTTPQMQGRRAVSTVAYTFVSVGGRAAVVDVRAAEGSREPIWLTGRLRVRGAGPGVVATAPTGPAARGLARRLRVARNEIRHFYGRSPHSPRGSLTAYLPGTAADFEGIVGGTPGQYRSVAAVTAPVGESTTHHDSPVAIVVNPQIWPHLRPVGAHVVITHEAVHATTGPVTAELPTWVAEGFADYVAVRSAGVPTDVASARAIMGVHTYGVPRRLPTAADFATTNPRLERTYELSRLAITSIARHYGRRRLVDFYEALVAHPHDLGGVLHRQLGTSTAVLTKQWRRLLVRLAGA